MPFRSNSFDLVIGRGVIHHLPNPEIGCKEAYRVLRKGGYLFISEPHSNFFLKLLRKIYYRFSNHFSETHKSFYKTEFLNFLERAGFRVIKYKYWGILSFPFAFPDILPLYKLMPYVVFRFLIKIDKILIRLPVINQFGWHILVIGRKK